jgi:hypothetical protein
MLRVRLTLKITSLRAVYTYTDGVLHSTNDDPAVMYRAKTGIPMWFRGLYLFAVDVPGPTGMHCSLSPGPALVGGNAESRWYDRGDLHRDFGPAVRGPRYWYKFHRGVLAASDGNTFSRLRRGHTTGSPCAKGPHCSCAKLVAAVHALQWDSYRYFARKIVCIYRTCENLVLECPRDKTVKGARDRFSCTYLEVGNECQLGTEGRTAFVATVIE